MEETPRSDDLETPATSTDRPEAPPEVEGGTTSTVIAYTLRFTGAPSLSQLVRDRRERNRLLTDRAQADFRAWQHTL